ncbi:MAG: FAD-dependent oxidoreductase [Verrucomicrobiae bacterium]|nr:FAD-dependent oxidoreductase [Verrucomicrobiae bacterium]
MKDLEGDILVAGGGCAGVCCAIAAARQGAKVILCQDRPVLGGNASSEVRMQISGANGTRKGKDLVLEPRETGIIEEIRLENAARNAQRSPSMFDLILYEKCRAEPNLTLLLNTRVVEAAAARKRIVSAEAVRGSTEDRFRLRAKVFADCTGDGGLGAAAGAAFVMGREAKARYGESLARERADRKTLGSTLLFMARKHDRPMPFVAPSWARKFTEKDLRLRPHHAPGRDFWLEYGYWWVEWGGQLDTIKDDESIRDELLAVVLGVWDHLKNGGAHDAKNWALDWFGMLPGKRESRRFLGQYVLTQRDVMESRPQPDAIAYGGWPIDLHPPEGVDRPDEPPCVQIRVPYLYDIPLRCCVARDFKNLMFAGRNFSATHVAFASTRVMATCAAVGEGVGVAAAWAAKNGVAPSELFSHPEAVREIRRRLSRQDVFLIGETSEDPDNLARRARISASSEQPGGAAANVLSVQNRCVRGPRGVAPERQQPGTHRWMSDPRQGLPAHLELRWEHPVSADEIELVFDTGLHRHLTLTQSDEAHQKMIWGGGQPETVKDFLVEMDGGRGLRAVARVENHWQRRWFFRSAKALRCRALRITAFSTWGLDHARIVRVTVRKRSTPRRMPSFSN